MKTGYSCVLWISLTLAVLIRLALAQVQSVPEPAAITGKLADGTMYRVSKPENWNGRLRQLDQPA